jgi:hypothetical protein
MWTADTLIGRPGTRRRYCINTSSATYIEGCGNQLSEPTTVFHVENFDGPNALKLLFAVHSPCGAASAFCVLSRKKEAFRIF